MNKFLKIGLVVMVIMGLVSFVGCKKTETSPPTTTEGTKPPVDANAKTPAIPPAANTTTKTPTTNVSALTSGALDTIPIADVRAAIAKMGVDELKAKAMEYKNLIREKAVENTNIVLKVKDIPVVEPAFTELMNKNKELEKTINALKDRYQLYIDKIEALGGDVSGLKLEQ